MPFFSSKSSTTGAGQRVRALNAALLKSKATEASLAARAHALHAQIDAESTRAQQLALRNPSAARAALTRRASAVHQESLLSRQLAALRQRTGQLEMAISTTQIVESAQETHRALMQVHRPDVAERVGELMDDVGDLMEEEADVAEVVAGDATTGPVIDVEEELRHLQELALPDVNDPTPLVQAPVVEPVPEKQHRRQQSLDVEALLAWSGNTV
jgi:hypothetical protein